MSPPIDLTPERLPTPLTDHLSYHHNGLRTSFMPTYLEIAVNVPGVTEVFHYHLPPELEGCIQPGHLVEVPFGRQRVQGVVLGFIDQPAVSETRPVLDLVDEQAVLTPVQLLLAQELADSTLSSLADCINLMLPPGLGQQSDTLYSLKAQKSAGPNSAMSEVQTRLVGLLRKRGPLRGRQLDQALRHVNWRNSARSLVRRGILDSKPVLLAPSVQPKFVRTAQLACPPEAARSELPGLGREGSKALERRQIMLRYLLNEPGPVEVAWLYAESGGSLADLRALADRGLVRLGESEVWRDPLEKADYQPTQAPQLTSGQQACWTELQKGIREAAGGQEVLPVLLHGVTGSGKTEIYLHAVENTLNLGRQAIILVPEIALTPQTVRRFLARFPGQVGLVHSGLSPGERYDTWRRARQGELGVVVGPRSALFTPLPNVGLIVLDECHDDSYYQDDQPIYDARQAALIYARLARAQCVMGSATPDITGTYQAARGSWRYLRLPARILAHQQAVEDQVKRLGQPSRYRKLEGQAETLDLPPVSVVDMREELKAGNRSIFSRELQTALANILERKQQAILFLNRRGTATYVFCRDCGHALKCPRCDLPLTFHGQDQALLCHHCAYSRKMPKTCPQCGSRRIRQYGTGTERVEAEIQELFPAARTLRWDYETTRKKGAHEAILSHFASFRADILIGTQMLAKGLDLPLVTLVGVILADVGLNLPDYRASERTFQVLTQVAGRAGRSPLGGEVILQTFEPDHYVIRAAANHNYRTFYQQELEYRRQLGYPPFQQLVRLEYRHTDPDRAEKEAQKMAAQIRNWLKLEGRKATELAGPVPCFFSRLGGNYRWQIVLRGPEPVSLLRGHPLNDWRIEINPPSLL
jgi:primosomal protein N' (replication factor Y)